MWFPSTSTKIPPDARSMTAGKDIPRDAETAAALRAIICSDFGPGIAVTTLRFCSTPVVNVLISPVYFGHEKMTT